MSLQNVVNTVNKWLFLSDTHVIKVLLGTVVANLLQGDPVWLFIIAPPSSAKTELIRALNKIPQIYPLSNLTPQTFISGRVSKINCSLLPQLNGKILTFKDFTTVLTMHREKRAEILAQLREIHDGQYKKAFGTGKIIEWSGKLGFISGVTPIIDTHYSIYTVLGERFIQYRIKQSDPIILAKKSMQNTGKEKEMREELSTVIAQFIKNIQIPSIDNIEISDEIKDKLAYLSTFCVTGRSGVIREGYHYREIIYTPEPEAPARLSKQLLTLSYGLAVVSGLKQVSMEDYSLIYKVGMDTLPKVRQDLLDFLSEHRDALTTSDISTEINYPTNTARRYLEDLHALKLIDRLKGEKGKADKWKLSNYAIGLLDKIRPYPKCQQESV